MQCHDFISPTFSLTRVDDAPNQVKYLTFHISSCSLLPNEQVCEIKATDRKIDDRLILLFEEVVPGESLDVNDEILGQSLDRILLLHSEL